MIVRKLRLQRGWTQEQLAEMSGLSVRSVQRIERGQSASLESLKSLAAVFEVELSLLQPGEDTMYDSNDDQDSRLRPDEEIAMNYVKGLKEFWSHLLMFAIFSVVFLFTDKFDGTMMAWILLGWSVGILLHGLVAYEVINIFGPGWEKKQIEKRLGRKL